MINREVIAVLRSGVALVEHSETLAEAAAALEILATSVMETIAAQPGIRGRLSTDARRERALNQASGTDRLGRTCEPLAVPSCCLPHFFSSCTLCP